MGWDNAGGYNRQHNFSADASAGVKILALRIDQELDDFASAMTVAWARNGQNVPTQNIPMGGRTFINVGAPSSVNNYARVREIIENVPIFMHDQESSADRISVSAQYFTSVSANQAPGDGTRIIVRANSTKASAVLYLNGHSANVEFQDGNVANGVMVSGGVYELIFSSVDAAWKVQNPTDGRTAAERAASVVPTNYQFSPGDVRRYGAVLDGTTDDTTALTNAIAQQQQTHGSTIEGVPGKTLKVSNWSAVTTSALLRIRGNGMTIQCGNTTAVAFVTCQANVDIEGATFDGFYRVISNPTGTSGSLTEFRFHKNRCIGARAGAGDGIANYIRLQNPCQNVYVTDNIFEDAKHAAVWIGDSVFANQDTWQKITVRGNRIDGVNVTSAGTFAFGILVYGREVVIDGNHVTDIDCSSTPAAGNGAYGIYTKARFARVVNNSVFDIGQAGSPESVFEFRGINVKGPDRGTTNDAQGYNCIVANNYVQNVGTADTNGLGIAGDRGDISVAGNIVEDCGGRGIYLPFGTAAIQDFRLVVGNAVYVTDAAVAGIELIPGANGRNVIANNSIRGGVGGIRVRCTSEDAANIDIEGNVIEVGTGASEPAIFLSADTNDVVNCTVRGNIVVSAASGVLLNTSDGGTYTRLLIVDNNLNGATSKIVGTPTATTRIRNNTGYKSENGGTSSAISTGGTIAHGLAATPTVFAAVPTASATDVVVTADATNLTVTFGGGGSVAFSWEAKTACHHQ